MQDDCLLDQRKLKRHFDQHLSKALSALEKINPDQLLTHDVAKSVEHVIETFKIDELVLLWDRRTADAPHFLEDLTKDPVRACDILGHTIWIPFEGDPDLLSILAASKTEAKPPFSGAIPLGFIENGALMLRLTASGDSSDLVATFQDRKKLIEQCLSLLKEEVDGFNTRLAASIRAKAARRQESYSGSITALSMLQIPLKVRAGEPNFQKVPLERKLARILKSEPQRGVNPERGISIDDYEHIVSVIRHAGRTFEQTPSTFAMHNEDGLRDIVLANLNGHYHGLAAAEAFRKTGKTDIRIEDAGRSAFVAECKIWDGPSTLKKAADQLLGYLTWRDCKASIIVFNVKNVQFQSILNKTPLALKEHPQFIDFDGPASSASRGEWRCRFSARGDSSQLITVHIFLFDLLVRH